MQHFPLFFAGSLQASSSGFDIASGGGSPAAAAAAATGANGGSLPLGFLEENSHKIENAAAAAATAASDTTASAAAQLPKNLTDEEKKKNEDDDDGLDLGELGAASKAEIVVKDKDGREIRVNAKDGSVIKQQPDKNG